MKLGLVWGYWGRGMPDAFVPLTQEAERLGYDSVWTAESWGSDAFSPLVWLAAHTERIRLGTGIVQLAARTPTATAMHAVTADHLSNQRLILGLGVSGPQVVEGWYGQPGNRPLARTREYVEILQAGVRQRRVPDFRGRLLQPPLQGRWRHRAGQAPQDHDPSSHGPTYPSSSAPKGPKNIAQTVEIADGWLPLYYSPFRPEVYAESIAGRSEEFEITVHTTVRVTGDSDEELAEALFPTKASLGFYIGGMGAKGQNYHTKLMARMGFEEEAYHIQDLFFEGRRDEAIASVPDQFADEISLVGSPERIRDRLAAWEESPVTGINVGARSADELRTIAEVILG